MLEKKNDSDIGFFGQKVVSRCSARLTKKLKKLVYLTHTDECLLFSKNHVNNQALNLSETNSLIRHKTNLFESKMSRMKKINENV